MIGCGTGSRGERGGGWGALLAIYAGLVLVEILTHSPAWDELGHLPAGILHWRTGDFRPYAVNPPLVRLIAALPVLRSESARELVVHPGDRPEWIAAGDFLKAAGSDVFALFFLARSALLPPLLVGPLSLYILGARYRCRSVGLAAAAMYCFSPTVLACSSLIIPDAVAASFTAATMLAFAIWHERASTPGAAAVGGTLGFACASKFTCLLLVPPLVAAALVRGWKTRTLLATMLHCLVCAAVALFVVAACYGFQEVGQPLESFRFCSRLFGGPEASLERPANRFRGTLLGRLPVPLPRQYLLGVDRQRLDFEQGYWSYMKGRWRKGGWYAYYAYAALVKEPEGYLILLAVALVGLVLFRQPAVVFHLLVAGVFLFVVVSSQTGFNHHYRYVLPALPLLYGSGCLALGGREDGVQGRLLRRIGWAGLLAGIAVSLSQVPHSESFFNYLSGGPYRGAEHLLDSNVDWGQDLLSLKRWLAAHPDVHLDGVVYRNIHADLLLRAAGLDRGRLPVDPAEAGSSGSGAFAVFVRALYEIDSPCAYLRGIAPRYYITPAVRIYVLNEEDGGEPTKTGTRGRQRARQKGNPGRTQADRSRARSRASAQPPTCSVKGCSVVRCGGRETPFRTAAAGRVLRLSACQGSRQQMERKRYE